VFEQQRPVPQRACRALYKHSRVVVRLAPTAVRAAPAGAIAHRPEALFTSRLGVVPRPSWPEPPPRRRRPQPGTHTIWRSEVGHSRPSMQRGHAGQPGDGYNLGAGGPGFPQQGGGQAQPGARLGQLPPPGQAHAGGQYAYAAAGSGDGYGDAAWMQGYGGPEAREQRGAPHIPGASGHSAAGGPSCRRAKAALPGAAAWRAGGRLLWLAALASGQHAARCLCSLPPSPIPLDLSHPHRCCLVAQPWTASCSPSSSTAAAQWARRCSTCRQRTRRTCLLPGRNSAMVLAQQRAAGLGSTTCTPSSTRRPSRATALG
jgi:hypothetical protein